MKSTFTWLILSLCITIVLAHVIVCVFYDDRLPYSYVSHTKNKLLTLRRCIELLAEGNHLLKGIQTLDDLLMRCVEHRVLVPAEAKELHNDAWGNPIGIKWQAHERGKVIVIHSYGPNGRDDSFGGDDMLVSCVNTIIMD